MKTAHKVIWFFIILIYISISWFMWVYFYFIESKAEELRKYMDHSVNPQPVLWSGPELMSATKQHQFPTSYFQE